MEENKICYYLIKGRFVGKREGYKVFIFDDGWKSNTECLIMDHLMGFDPSEPPDSPYRIGNTCVLEEIEEISYETAMGFTGGVA